MVKKIKKTNKANKIMMIAFLIFTCGLALLTVKADTGMENLYDKQQQRTFRVAFDPEMPPFQYETLMKGEYDGFGIQLLEYIADQNLFQIHWQAMSREEAIRRLKENRIDMILGMTYQARYAQEMEFSEPYFSSSIALVVPKDAADEVKNIADLAEKLVAVQRNSIAYEFLHNVRRIDFNGTHSQKKAFDLLVKGRADALIGDRLVLQHYLEEANLTEDYVVTSSFIMPVEYSMAVRSENYTDLNLLNRGISQARGQSEYQAIYDQWFGENDLQRRLENLLRFLVILGGAGIIVFLGILWWNRLLKEEVQRKTKELKRANEDLSRQIQETLNMGELKNQILENSPRGLVTMDMKGLITSINPRAIQIIDLMQPSEEIFYQEVELLRYMLENKLEDVLLKGTQFIGDELSWKKMDIRYTVYPLRNYEKIVVGAIVSFEDITEEKKMREQGFEKEKSRALNQVVAGIAHEIRNPLTSIKTFVEVLPSKINNPKFQKDIVRLVPREIDRVSQLIERLIDYAKPQKTQKKKVDLDKIIESCVSLFKPSFEKKGMKIRAEVKQPLLVYADRDQIKQVLVNFMLNGMEAMEAKERREESEEILTMTIRGMETDEFIEVLISDEGVGLNQTEINMMMEPFYTTKKGGTGLGLTLSKKYIEENNGHVYFESIKGEGTTVHLQFERMKT
ncbi:amino acid-binding domain sensor histidine kinase [Tindallia magadiensis]|uniref:histidine kinase n=1 Tax=Tindallia magadiensis TaxID=69895 RepID=A0A1I3CD45_9FIRM|nr:amino acid-binding domain sensor histidine kinase [Tindallia magadiensis]